MLCYLVSIVLLIIILFSDLCQFGFTEKQLLSYEHKRLIEVRGVPVKDKGGGNGFRGSL